MLLSTHIYLFPTKELEMDIAPENRSWERVATILDLKKIMYAYSNSQDTYSPGDKDKTIITFDGGDELMVAIPYNKFIEIWKNSMTNE